MQILKDHHLRPHLSGPQQQAAQSVEDLGPAQLRVHSAHSRVPRVDREQIAQIGQNRAQCLAEAQDAPFDLLDNGAFGIPFLDTEVTLEQVDYSRHSAPRL
jgi:hypothetical protein